MHDFRRDIQAKIGTKTNINLGPTIENYGGETFLSQEVAINLLQESKMAFKRCQVVGAQFIKCISKCYLCIVACKLLP